MCWSYFDAHWERSKHPSGTLHPIWVGPCEKVKVSDRARAAASRLPDQSTDVILCAIVWLCDRTSDDLYYQTLFDRLYAELARRV